MAVKKWMKYEVLFKYGLASKNELLSQIRRYPRADTKKLCEEISCDMEKCTASNVYILKIVPAELRFKLRNYVLKEKSDLDDVVEDLKGQSDYEEIWCCKTPLDLCQHSIYGRLYINNGCTMEVAQYIEQVWADTGRKLECISMYQEIPHIRAKRLGWGRRYNIDAMNFGKRDSAEMMNMFWQTVKQLELQRSNLEEFADDLYDTGIYSFDVEYKVINGRLFIIDWDTPHDKLVLRKLL